LFGELLAGAAASPVALGKRLNRGLLLRTDRRANDTTRCAQRKVSRTPTRICLDERRRVVRRRFVRREND
jgi:hypothetical protein